MSSAVKGFPRKFPVRDDDGRSRRYRIAACLARIYLRCLPRSRLQVEGEDNIPAEGPLLVVCNHISNLDPIVFGGFFRPTLFAMAKRELYVNAAVSWFLGGCNCIPVDRGSADRRAVTRALDVLRARGRLLVFVEGTRSPTGAMQRAEPGVGFLARRSGATIVPVAISGTDGRHPWPRRGWRHTMRLQYGRAFRPELTGRRDDPTIADEIATRIAVMLPPQLRGVYGGEDGGDRREWPPVSSAE